MASFKKIAVVVGAALGVVASGAQASLVTDQWTFKLQGVDGLDAPLVVNNVDEITFAGIAHAQTFTTNARPGVGDVGRTDGLLAATTYTIGGSQALGPSTYLGVGYEMTMTFSVASYTYAASGINSNFTHIVNPTIADGLLHIYIDNLGVLDSNGDFGTAVKANKVTGNGYSDGVEILTFKLVPGGGGVFTGATYDGSDDATFELTYALPGVVFDKDGKDVSTKLGTSVLVTDSNFDADSNNDGTPDVAAPTSGVLGSCPAGGCNLTNFYALEDGSSGFANKVPEPSSMLLLGGGMLGLAGLSRRKSARRA